MCIWVNIIVFFIIVPLIIWFYDVCVAEKKCKSLQKCAHKYTLTYYFPFDVTEFTAFVFSATYIFYDPFLCDVVCTFVVVFVVFPSYLWDTQWASVFMWFFLPSIPLLFIVFLFVNCYFFLYLLLLLLFTRK